MLKEEDKKRLQERFQEEASDVYQPFSKELFKQYSAAAHDNDVVILVHRCSSLMTDRR